MSVCSLFLVDGHNVERICTKFGVWHPYALHMVMGVSERRSSSRARAQRARIGRLNGSSAVGARTERYSKRTKQRTDERKNRTATCTLQRPKKMASFAAVSLVTIH